MRGESSKITNYWLVEKVPNQTDFVVAAVDNEVIELSDKEMEPGEVFKKEETLPGGIIELESNKEMEPSEGSKNGEAPGGIHENTETSRRY